MKDLIKKIVIGSWSFSGNLGKTNSRDSHEAIICSIENNIKYFDTAPVYGNGKVDKLLSVYKEHISVNTKCGYNSNGSKKTFKKNDIKASLEKSLKLFNKINILYLHNPREEIKDWDEIISLMQDLKKQKLINYTGISLARGYYFNKDILSQFDYIQDDLNLLRLGNLKYLTKLKTKIVARSPLATGLLTDKFNSKTKFSRNDYRNEWCKGERFKNILKQVNEIKKINGKNRDISEFAQLYLLQNKNINLINFGVKNKKQVNSLLNLLKKKKITKKMSNNLFKLLQNNYNISKSKVLY